MRGGDAHADMLQQETLRDRELNLGLLEFQPGERRPVRRHVIRQSLAVDLGDEHRGDRVVIRRRHGDALGGVAVVVDHRKLGARLRRKINLLQEEVFTPLDQGRLAGKVLLDRLQGLPHIDQRHGRRRIIRHRTDPRRGGY